MMKKTIWIKNFESRDEIESIKTVFENIKEVESVTVDYSARTISLKTNEDFSDSKIRELFKKNNFNFEIEKID